MEITDLKKWKEEHENEILDIYNYIFLKNKLNHHKSSLYQKGVITTMTIKSTNKNFIKKGVNRLVHDRNILSSKKP